MILQNIDSKQNMVLKLSVKIQTNNCLFLLSINLSHNFTITGLSVWYIQTM